MPGRRATAGAFAAWLRSDSFPRILPFALFMLFVAAGSLLPAPVPAAPGAWDVRWIYAARALVAGAALALLWPRFVELRAFGLRASEVLLGSVAGVAVLVVWVLLDEGWVTFELGSGFDPRRHASEEIDWTLTFFRLLGLALVVPVIEELFWRSFLMRWLARPDFLQVDPAKVGARALVLTSVLFGLEHSQWLAGLVAGLVYGWVYMHSRNLWVPVLAHAVTNAGLGIYILIARDWRFW